MMMMMMMMIMMIIMMMRMMVRMIMMRMMMMPTELILILETIRTIKVNYWLVVVMMILIDQRWYGMYRRVGSSD